MEDFLISFRKRAALIKEQYPSFKMWNDGSAIMLYQGIQEHQLIKEFINPVPVDKVITILNNEFGEYINFSSKQKQGNSYFITMELHKLKEGILDSIEKKLDSLGYYISNKDQVRNYKLKFEKTSMEDLSKRFLYTQIFYLQIEPKYDNPVRPHKKLYHLTPDYNWKKIRTLGLTPRTQNKKILNHPGRIYLISVDKMNESFFDNFAESLWFESKDKEYIQNMELLEIDTDKLKGNKFYEDPNTGGDEEEEYEEEAIYTYENIPPFAIKHIKSILVNPRVKDRK